jgi:hypothetical protein
MLNAFFFGIGSCQLGRIRGAFSRSLKTGHTGRSRSYYITLWVSKSNNCIIESRLNICPTQRYILTLFLPDPSRFFDNLLS